MVDSKIIRHLFCIFCFILRRSRKTCHISVLPVIVGALICHVFGNIGHCTDNSGRIKSSGKSGTKCHITSHADLAGIQKQFAELLYLFLIGIRYADQMI